MFTFKLFANHFSFNKKPIKKEEIDKNQNIRLNSVFTFLSEKSLDQKAIAAVKKFWANQTYFLVDFLLRNKEELQKYFPDIVLNSEKISKTVLLQMLDQILVALNKKDRGAKKIIKLITQDCRLPFSSMSSSSSDSHEINSSNETLANLFVVAGDSVKFAYEQSLQGKRVLIMDAANAQRPGAAAYEKGTFQEALTRTTDLYSKVLVDFRNVLAALLQDHKAAVLIDAVAIEQVDVFDYQCRFLSLILYFIKKSLADDNYVVTKDFREEFLNYANQIYGRMQNIVFELPTSAGFLKNCRMVDLEARNVSDLFDEEDFFKLGLLSSVQTRVFIVETAAPDKRWLHGQYDRGCTFNSELRVSDEAHMATQLIRGSIIYTLQQAVNNNIDIILLNAFGCGAFGNDPKIVASIFAEIISNFAEHLVGKTIYFMDLNKEMCATFGEKFHDTFALNPQWNFSANLDANVHDAAIATSSNTSTLPSLKS